MTDQTRWLRLGGAGIPEARHADLLRLDPARDRASLLESRAARRVIATARYAATGIEPRRRSWSTTPARDSDSDG